MRIDIVTLFPEYFESTFRTSLLGRAIADGILDIGFTNPRDYTRDRHRTVDDTPFGGGPGMVMKCAPLVDAVEAIWAAQGPARALLFSPKGRRLDQPLVRELASAPALVMICGRYEGVDERVAEALGAEEVSIGDYVLSGGEAAALVLVEALSRMLPGVIGDWGSVSSDSFFDGLLAPPQYTRPPEFRGREVPPVLLSGNHAAIARWRLEEAKRLTAQRRPELLEDDRQQKTDRE